MILNYVKLYRGIFILLLFIGLYGGAFVDRVNAQVPTGVPGIFSIDHSDKSGGSFLLTLPSDNITAVKCNTFTQGGCTQSAINSYQSYITAGGTEYVWFFYDSDYFNANYPANWSTLFSNVANNIANPNRLSNYFSSVYGNGHSWGNSSFSSYVNDTKESDNIYGCTDILNVNFDINSAFDDGSCNYTPPGPGPFVPLTFSLFPTTTESSDLIASVAGGVQETGKAIWPMFAFVGIGLAFIIALQVVVFTKRAVTGGTGGTSGADPVKIAPLRDSKGRFRKLPRTGDYTAYRRGKKANKDDGIDLGL